MIKKATFILAIMLVLAMTVRAGMSGLGQAGIVTSLNGESQFLYLPIITKNYPKLTIFGMDGSSDFNRIAQTGASWVRLNTALLWSEVQPDGPNTWNWSSSNAQRIESEILQAKSQGLAVLLIVRSTPRWAMKYPNTEKRCGPIARDKFDEFALFMREVVKRYSDPQFGVMYYAIWNEPDAPLANTNGDLPFGCWGDPNERYFGGVYYGELLREVYLAVKPINPNVQIVVGSLLMYCDPRWVGYGSCPRNPSDPSDPSFLPRNNFFEGVLIGSQGMFDIVGYNGHVSYAAGKNPVWNERTNWRWAKSGGLVDGKVNYLQEKMTQILGHQKPIMLTEGGLKDGVSGDAGFEAAKAHYIVYGYANTWAMGLKANFWYTFRGWGGSELIRGTTLRPAFYAMQTMTSILKEADFISREVYSGFEKFVYHLGNQEIWLLIPTGEWADTTYTISRPSNFVKLVDIYGNQLPDPGSTIVFSRPTYVFLNR